MHRRNDVFSQIDNTSDAHYTKVFFKIDDVAIRIHSKLDVDPGTDDDAFPTSF